MYSACTTSHRRLSRACHAVLLLLFVLVSASAWGAIPDLAPYLRGAVDSVRDAYHVEVRNNFAYVANDINGLQIYNVSNPANPVWVAAYTNSDAALDVSLGNSPTLNYAFVAIGASGIDVINIADPTHPLFVTNISTDVIDLQANAVMVQPNSGNNIYIADDIFGIKVFRVTNPAGTTLGSFDPTNLVGQAATEGAATDLAIPPNNFAILFVADGDGGCTRMSVSSSSNPFETGNTPLDGTALGIAASSITAFVACDDAGLETVDISSMAKKKQFLTGSSAHGVFTANNRVYLSTSEGGEMIIDVSTATQQRVGTYYTGFSNAAYGSTLVGSNLYVAAGGLLVLGTNLLSNPQTFSSFTATDLNGDVSDVNAVAVYGTNALVADNNLGLLSVSVANPGNPKLLSVIADATSPVPEDIFISGNFAYMAEDNDGVGILDLSSNFGPAFQLSTPSGPALAVIVNSFYAYIACGAGGLQIADVSDPYFPVGLGQFISTNGFVDGIAYTNGFVFLADGSKGLTVVDVSDPNNPLGIGSSLTTTGFANAVAISGHYAFIADGGIGLSVVDIADPFHLKYVAGLDIGDTANGIAIDGNYAYISDGLAGMLVVDISNPTHPVQVGSNTSFDGLHNVLVYSNRVYVAAGLGGMPIMDVFHGIKFASPPTLAGSSVHVMVSGPTNGQPVRIQRNSNLTNRAGWTDWQTLTFTNANFVDLVDTNNTAAGHIFYRGIAP